MAKFREYKMSGSRLRKLTLLFFSGVFLFSTFQPLAISGKEVREVSPEEAEDRDFIRNLFKDKHYTFADEEADGYLSKYPSGAFRDEIIFVRAQIDTINKKYTKALDKYDLLLKKHRGSPYVENSLYLAGVLRIQLGEMEKSGDCFRSLLRQYPKSKFRSKASFHLGQLAFKKKKWKNAEGRFQTSLRTKGLSKKQKLEARRLLAWTYHFQGQRKPAKDLFLKLLDSDLSGGNKANICFQLAIDAQKDKRYRDAINWHERLLRNWPNSKSQYKTRFLLAESLYQIHASFPSKLTLAEKQKATKLFTQNLGLPNPIEPVNSRFYRGWLYFALQLDEKAEQDFRWLQKNRRKYARDINMSLTRADYFEKKRNWKMANQMYFAALKFQKKPVERNSLFFYVIRNEYRLKNCKSVLRWKREIDPALEVLDPTELRFYTGKCQFVAKQWEQAGYNFSKIPLESRFGGLIFMDYLTVFRRTYNLEGGVDLLERASKHSKLGSREQMLTLKVEFCSYRKHWPCTLRAMEETTVEVPGKNNDPWFLMNMAMIHDRIIEAPEDIRRNWRNPAAQPLEYHEKQALSYYETSYERLPKDRTEEALSILDILIKRYEKKKNYRKVASLYQKALVLVKNPSRKADLTMGIAKIQLDRFKNKPEAQKWLYRLHLKDDLEVNFEASSLLAELLIEKEDRTEAIKVLLALSRQPIKGTQWYFPVHYRLGELFQNMEKWDEASNHYSLVANTKQNTPLKKDARARLLKIRKYSINILIARAEKNKDFENAVVLYQEALKLANSESQKDEMRLRIAKIQMKHLGNMNEARLWFLELHLKGNRDINYEASSLLAEMLIEQKRLSDAVKVLLALSQQPIEDTQWYFPVQYRLGELHHMLENWNEAVKHYDLVANTNQSTPLKKAARARLLDIRKYLTDIRIEHAEKNKEYRKVVGLYLEALELARDESRKDEMRLRIAKIQFKHLNKTREARSGLLILHLKGNGEIYYEASSILAELAIAQKKYSQAIRILSELSRQAIKNTRWYYPVHYRLGELYQSQEKWRKAINHYRLVANARLKTPHQKEAQTHLAAITKYLKQLNAGKKPLKKSTKPGSK